MKSGVTFTAKCYTKFCDDQPTCLKVNVGSHINMQHSEFINLQDEKAKTDI